MGARLEVVVMGVGVSCGYRAGMLGNWLDREKDNN
jgi:hypothetical protein